MRARWTSLGARLYLRGADMNDGAVGSVENRGNFGTNYFNDIELTPVSVETRAGRVSFKMAVMSAKTAVTEEA